MNQPGNIQGQPTSEFFRRFFTSVLTPVDTSKFLFAASPGFNDGSTVDTVYLFSMKNTDPLLAVFLAWVKLVNVTGNLTDAVYAVGNIENQSIAAHISAGIVWPASQSVFAPLQMSPSVSDGEHYVGTYRISEVCGWAFKRAADNVFGNPASSYAEFQANVIGAQSFKFQPNLTVPYDFTYSSGGG